MAIFYKRSDRKRNLIHGAFVTLVLFALSVSVWHMLSHAHEALEIGSTDYENILQTKIMWYKLKFSGGLVGVGTLVAYVLFQAISHSPLGACMWVYDKEKDCDPVKAAKTLSMGVVFASFVMGMFYVVSSIIGR
jgi:hypothetical protein